MVQVTAIEHDDNSYIVENSNRGTIGGVEGIEQIKLLKSPLVLGLLPISLRVQLSWTNSANFKLSTYSTEVYASDTNDRSAVHFRY